jgi:hypothetical protein
VDQDRGLVHGGPQATDTVAAHRILPSGRCGSSTLAVRGGGGRGECGGSGDALNEDGEVARWC